MRLLSPKRRRFLLNLEELEERITPTTYTVIDTSDNAADYNSATKQGSLRAIVAQVDTDGSANDTINFAPGLTGTITLSPTNSFLELSASQTVAINGPGASQLTISGNNATELFQIDPNVTATISGLTLAEGYINNGGGAIYNEGTLTLSDCALNNNSSPVYGGAIDNAGTLTSDDSAFSSKSGDFDGLAWAWRRHLQL